MTLEERIRGDLTVAQKGGDAARVGTLRFLLAQMHNREIEKRGAGKEPTLTDDEVMDVLRREAKKRREAIELFTRGGRADLRDRETAELAVIESYLPAAMSRAEIEAIVDGLMAKGLSDFNQLIRAAMQELKGKADGSLVSQVIRERLQKPQ
jgi:hypothetical protein